MANESWQASLLPGNATPLETAVSLTNAARYPLPAHLIASIADPLTVPEHLIAYTAWHYSVDLWDENWPLAKKRAAIVRQIELARIKGTQAAIEGYVELAGSEVLEVLSPPQGVFMAAEPDKAEMNAYLARLPAIRVYRADTRGVADAGIYLDDGFFDEDALTTDVGPGLFGRRAVLLADGVETPLKVFGVDISVEQRTARDVERVSIPGLAGPALFADGGFWDDAVFDMVEKPALLVSFKLDVNYDHASDQLWLTTLTPGLEPVEPRYERVSAIGESDAGLFDGTFWDGDFYVPDADLMFDQMRLFDPSIAAPLADGLSFYDDARWDMPAFTAEVMIKTDRTARRSEGFWDDDVWDDLYSTPTELGLQELALDAVALAKEHHAKVLVTFETTRPVQFGDAIPMDGSFTFNSRVRAHL